MLVKYVIYLDTDLYLLQDTGAGNCFLCIETTVLCIKAIASEKNLRRSQK